MEKQISAEVERLNKDKKYRRKKRKVHLILLQKSLFFNKKPEQVEQQVTTTIQILIWKYHNGAKQAVVKRKILNVSEKVTLKL